MDQTCRPCEEPDRPVSAVTVAVVVIAAIVLIYYLASPRGRRDKFVSRQALEVYRSSRELFERTGGTATFSEFKSVAPDADAVIYSDARALWKKGELSPERLQEML